MKGIWFLCFVCVTGVSCSKKCIDIKDCVTCTNSKTKVLLKSVECRWCPLDQKCHTHGSVLYNPCKINQNIKNPAYCLDVENGEYKPDVAFSTTLLSSAAYSDDPETCLHNIYPESGIKIYKLALSDCDGKFLFKYEECFAYIGISDVMETIIIAFRGTTKVYQLIDEAVSVIFKFKKKFRGIGNVQEYFKTAFDKFTPCLHQELKNLLQVNPVYRNYKVVVTGHSLGGALASLQAITLVDENIVPKDKLFLYTFGQPRVGEQNYALGFDERVSNSFRLVHYDDIVPYLPTKLPNALAGPYHHRREVFYFRQEMTVGSEYKLAAMNEDPDLRNSLGLGSEESHKTYFGINVGNACKGIFRKKRSTGQTHSEMWHFLKNGNCTIIDPKEYSDYIHVNTVTKVFNSASKIGNFFEISFFFFFCYTVNLKLFAMFI